MTGLISLAMPKYKASNCNLPLCHHVLWKRLVRECRYSVTHWDPFVCHHRPSVDPGCGQWGAVGAGEHTARKPSVGLSSLQRGAVHAEGGKRNVLLTPLKSQPLGLIQPSRLTGIWISPSPLFFCVAWVPFSPRCPLKKESICTFQRSPP